MITKEIINKNSSLIINAISFKFSFKDKKFIDEIKLNIKNKDLEAVWAKFYRNNHNKMNNSNENFKTQNMIRSTLFDTIYKKNYIYQKYFRFMQLDLSNANSIRWNILWLVVILYFCFGIEFFLRKIYQFYFNIR